MPPARALKILFDTYWSAAGWKTSFTTPSEDYEYAKQAGVMFDPARWTHDEIVARGIAARDRVTPQAVTGAFVASLTNRRLDLRSALASWALLRHLRPHKEVIVRPEAGCRTCGEPGEAEADLSVMNFERHKWGGVRHTIVGYSAFDLEQFARLDPVVPQPADVAVLRELLDIAARCSPTDTATDLVAKLTKCKVPGGSKPERAILVDVLGICGVLPVRGRASFLAEFTEWSKRDLPSQRFVERAYPVCWWRGSDGVRRETVSTLFGTH